MCFYAIATEPWMQKEIVKYYKGRNLLAKLMGEDPEKFTENDVQVRGTRSLGRGLRGQRLIQGVWGGGQGTVRGWRDKVPPSCTPQSL